MGAGAGLAKLCSRRPEAAAATLLLQTGGDFLIPKCFIPSSGLSPCSNVHCQSCLKQGPLYRAVPCPVQVPWWVVGVEGPCITAEEGLCASWVLSSGLAAARSRSWRPSCHRPGNGSWLHCGHLCSVAGVRSQCPGRPVCSSGSVICEQLSCDHSSKLFKHLSVWCPRESTKPCRQKIWI